MKTIFQKVVRFSLILFIPVVLSTMTSCQEDIQDPYSSVPTKSKIKGVPR